MTGLRRSERKIAGVGIFEDVSAAGYREAILRSTGADLEQFQEANTVAEKPAYAVFLFFSMDLVGSTAVKHADPNWMDHIRVFYDAAKMEVKEKLPDAVVWKYIGDEITFYTRVSTDKAFVDWIKNAHKVVYKLANVMEERISHDGAPRLSVKGVIWMGVARVAGESAPDGDALHAVLSGNAVDVAFKTKIENGTDTVELTDFLGPATDIGFRIARFARRRQLVVGASLADYCVQRSTFSAELRVLDFESLKGVMRGAMYPAIWYRPEWKGVENDFQYEERYSDELVRRACRAPELEQASILRDVRRRDDNRLHFFDADTVDGIIAADRSRNVLAVTDAASRQLHNGGSHSP